MYILQWISKINFCWLVQSMCQSCCLKYIKTKFIQYFYFSFIKQRKPNDTTVSITLPVIPDAPPPGAAVELPGAAALDPWHNPAMSEIVVCRGKTSAYDQPKIRRNISVQSPNQLLPLYPVNNCFATPSSTDESIITSKCRTAVLFLFCWFRTILH